MNNKLYCTFVSPGEEVQLAQSLFQNYPILFEKVFILSIPNEDKIVLTYNIDHNNYKENLTIPNTILVHRKKQTNTLYTINALNELIIYLNHGVLDTRFRIPWEDYRNSLLLNDENGFKQLNTKLKEIVES